MSSPDAGPGWGEDVEAEQLTRVRRPSRYEVLLHDDDYTTMEFVVHVLKSVFRKDHQEAVRIMLEVHHRGIGVAGVYSREVAEARVARVIELAREAGMPLRCSMQPQ